MNTFTLVVGCLQFVAGLVHAQPLPADGHSAEAGHANLVVIVADDLARWALGAYGNGEARTPNIDRLAREGAKFTRAYAATPVCSPSRATLLTGLYGTQVGVTDHISPDDAQRGVGLPAEAATWPAALQARGYRTGLVGKWHLGEAPQFHPTRHGFGFFYGRLDGVNEPLNPVVEADGKSKAEHGYLVDLTTDAAARFIAESRQRPFALSIHYNAPHHPYTPVAPPDAAPFLNSNPAVPDLAGLSRPQLQGFYRDYYASIHALDRNVGRILDILDRFQLAERTVVVLISDHGYNLGQHRLRGKGNGVWIAGGMDGPTRPNMFETSLVIPVVVRWPGVVAPGREIPQLVAMTDFYPSVLAMAGVEASSEARPVRQGMSFLPLLRGEKPIHWRDAVFGQYDLHNNGLAYLRMVRTERYKLVRHYRATGLDELYDLRHDPEETQNLYGDTGHRQVREQLQQRLTAWMQSIGDPLAP
jgi:uncharacterized sulfatase